MTTENDRIIKYNPNAEKSGNAKTSPYYRNEDDYVNILTPLNSTPILSLFSVMDVELTIADAKKRPELLIHYK
jgi:hypothetical protein